jgi:hypothetical protein
MDYDGAIKKYIELRDENAAITKEADAKVAANKEKMEKIGVWIQLKAEGDQLSKVSTKHGTVFWTEGARCNVSNSDAFFEFVKQHEAWEMIEKRASKTGVRDYVNTFKEIPPGVDYATIKQINVRKV